MFVRGQTGGLQGIGPRGEFAAQSGGAVGLRSGEVAAFVFVGAEVEETVGLAGFVEQLPLAFADGGLRPEAPVERGVRGGGIPASEVREETG